MRALRILDDVYLIGSGEVGLSHALDCNVYLLDGGNEAALIDAGSGFDTEQLLSNITDTGTPLEWIRYLLLTHCHMDHARGCHSMRERLGCQIVASAEEARLLKEGTEFELGLEQAKYARVYPDDLNFIHSRADCIIGDGELQVGKYKVKTIMVPGHTLGMMCYFVTTAQGNALFVGDTLFWGGKIGLSNVGGSDLSVYRTGLPKLADLNVDALLPGHFLWTVRGGQAHIDKALKALKGSQIPPLPNW
jgi:hydroxyacylglutathione hydrolase